LLPRLFMAIQREDRFPVIRHRPGDALLPCQPLERTLNFPFQAD
jgi:hypothetical protein